MDNLIRFLFILYYFLMGVVSLYVGDFDPSSILAVFGFTCALIFYIIAAFALQTAHKKDGRSKIDWLVLAAYPFLIYFLVFSDFDESRPFFWILPGYFYFSIIAGGFLGGICLSPILARSDRYSKEEIEGIVDRGRAITNWPLSLFSVMLLLTLLLALIYVPLTLLRDLEGVRTWRRGLFILLFSAGILRVVQFGYRHTIFHIRRDPELQQKYPQSREDKQKQEWPGGPS